MIYHAYRISLPFYGRMLIESNNTWYGKTVTHSPKAWPWWKLFSIVPVRTNPELPRKPGYHSWNVWLYTRKDAICIHTCIVHKSVTDTDMDERNPIVSILEWIGIVTRRGNGTIRWPLSFGPAHMWRNPMACIKVGGWFYVFRNAPGFIKWREGRLLPVRWGFGIMGGLIEFGDRG